MNISIDLLCVWVKVNRLVIFKGLFHLHLSMVLWSTWMEGDIRDTFSDNICSGIIEHKRHFALLKYLPSFCVCLYHVNLFPIPHLIPSPEWFNYKYDTYLCRIDGVLAIKTLNTVIFKSLIHLIVQYLNAFRPWVFEVKAQFGHLLILWGGNSRALILRCQNFARRENFPNRESTTFHNK